MPADVSIDGGEPDLMLFTPAAAAPGKETATANKGQPESAPQGQTVTGTGKKLQSGRQPWWSGRLWRRQHRAAAAPDKAAADQPKSATQGQTAGASQSLARSCSLRGGLDGPADGGENSAHARVS